MIRKWASEKGRGIGEMDSKDIDGVNISDLTLRLGYPYLFMHRGDCEHLVVFSDLRMFNPNVDAQMKDFPIQCCTKKRCPIRCSMCNLNTAKYFVENDMRLPQLPYFLCTNCKDCYYSDPGPDLKIVKYLDRTATL